MARLACVVARFVLNLLESKGRRYQPQQESSPKPPLPRNVNHRIHSLLRTLQHVSGPPGGGVANPLSLVTRGPSTRTDLIKGSDVLVCQDDRLLQQLQLVATLLSSRTPYGLRVTSPGLLEIGRIIKQYRQLDASVPVLREVGLSGSAGSKVDAVSSGGNSTSEFRNMIRLPWSYGLAPQMRCGMPTLPHHGAK